MVEHLVAVIATGGKQVVVRPGQKVRVDKLVGTAGDAVAFSEVLLVTSGGKTTVGNPTVAGASVTGTIRAQGRAKKVVGVKFKPKKRQRTTFGHRQQYTEVEIGAIVT